MPRGVGLGAITAVAVSALMLASAPLHGQSLDVAASPRAQRDSGLERDIVGLNPPGNRDLRLTISDVRLLADGREVQFTVRNRLRFTRGEGGMIATLRRDSVDCTGPHALCAAFERALASWTGTVQRYAVATDGTIRTLVDANLASVGEGTPRAAAALAEVQELQPGALGMAELREALRYAGLPLDQQLLKASAAVAPDEIAISRADRQQASIISRTSLHLDAGSGGPFEREQRERVDLVSGLLLESVTVVHDLDPDHRPLSIRRWSLTL